MLLLISLLHLSLSRICGMYQVSNNSKKYFYLYHYSLFIPMYYLFKQASKMVKYCRLRIKSDKTIFLPLEMNTFLPFFFNITSPFTINTYIILCIGV